MSDLEALTNIVNNKVRKFTNETFIYKFTNERLSSYLPLFDFKNKDVMTVVGSGDHYLNILLNDINSLECFDINKFAYYYLVLKKYAIISLSNDEFIKFFLSNDFDLNLYQKIRSNFKQQDLNILFFWDNVMRLKTSQRMNLFSDEVKKEKVIESNNYLKKCEYLVLKDKLREFEIKFIQANLKKLHLDDKIQEYDYIFISNITDYLFCIFNDNVVKHYKNLLINDFDKIVKPNGRVVAYQFDNKFDFDFSLVGVSNALELYQKLGYYFSNIKVDNDALMVYKKIR